MALKKNIECQYFFSMPNAWPIYWKISKIKWFLKGVMAQIFFSLWNWLLTTSPIYQEQHIEKSTKLDNFWGSYVQKTFFSWNCVRHAEVDRPTYLPGATYQKISQICWFLKDLWPNWTIFEEVMSKKHFFREIVLGKQGLTTSPIYQEQHIKKSAKLADFLICYSW